MEPIVFVNEAGRPTGKTAPKLESHHEDTELHLAFSCYVVNDHGELLVTKRAATKKVWPGFWTNTVCGHPLPGESLHDAVIRRLSYELNITAQNITPVLPNYRYTAPAYNGVIENEYCPVFFARSSMEPKPNPQEVEAYMWMSWDEFVTQTSADSNVYEQFATIGENYVKPSDAPEWSWWCKDQLKNLQNNEIIKEFTETSSS